jgi:hypothetical protein
LRQKLQVDQLGLASRPDLLLCFLDDVNQELPEPLMRVLKEVLQLDVSAIEEVTVGVNGEVASCRWRLQGRQRTGRQDKVSRTVTAVQRCAGGSGTESLQKPTASQAAVS